MSEYVGECVTVYQNVPFWRIKNNLYFELIVLKALGDENIQCSFCCASTYNIKYRRIARIEVKKIDSENMSTLNTYSNMCKLYMFSIHRDQLMC